MPFCANCGTNVSGTFCPNCGTPVGAAGGQPPSQPMYTPGPAQGAGMSENVACLLCYVAGLITGIIFLVVAPYNTNPRVKFHAWQSICFNIAWIAVWVVLGFVMSMMSGFGLFLLPLYPLVSLCGFGLWLFLMFKAHSGENFELPIIGPIAKQQAAK